MSTRELIRFLLQLIRPYRRTFWFGSFLRFATDILNLVPAYALASIINRLSAHDYSSGIWYFVGLWPAVLVVQYLGRTVAKYYGYLTGERIALDAHIQTVEHLFLLDISWHERENSGNKLKRILKGTDGIDKLIRLWIDSIIEVIVNYIGVVIVLFHFSHGVAGAALVFLVTFFMLSYRLIGKAAATGDQVNQFEERLSGQSYEAVNNIRTVKVLDLAQGFSDKIKLYASETLAKIKERIYRYRVYGIVTELYSITFRFLIVAYIVYGIIQGRFEVGFLVLFWAYFSRIWESARELADSTQQFSDAKYDIARLHATLHEPINIDDESNKLDFAEDWKTIRFIDVSFAYGDNEVLKNISFEIKRGERIGVVGLSGAGKSTLIKLLLKEHESYTGDILFDDVSIREMKKSSYLKRVAVVLQDTEVFNFSLKENITIASQETENEFERLQDALHTAHVTDFIERLPDGINTLIGEKGIKLSGGERQRLGIARAIYKKPEILFLDEATSHLDLESEEKIQDSLHHFFQEVTAMVIAHRLSTIKEMDRILVIEHGQIIDSGTFEELKKRRVGSFRLL